MCILNAEFCKSKVEYYYENIIKRLNNSELFHLPLARVKQIVWQAPYYNILASFNCLNLLAGLNHCYILSYATV